MCKKMRYWKKTNLFCTYGENLLVCETADPIRFHYTNSATEKTIKGQRYLCGQRGLKKDEPNLHNQDIVLEIFSSSPFIF